MCSLYENTYTQLYAFNMYIAVKCELYIYIYYIASIIQLILGTLLNRLTARLLLLLANPLDINVHTVPQSEINDISNTSIKISCRSSIKPMIYINTHAYIILSSSYYYTVASYSQLPCCFVNVTICGEWHNKLNAFYCFILYPRQIHSCIIQIQ